MKSFPRHPHQASKKSRSLKISLCVVCVCVESTSWFAAPGNSMFDHMQFTVEGRKPKTMKECFVLTDVPSKFENSTSQSKTNIVRKMSQHLCAFLLNASTCRHSRWWTTSNFNGWRWHVDAHHCGMDDQLALRHSTLSGDICSEPSNIGTRRDKEQTIPSVKDVAGQVSNTLQFNHYGTLWNPHDCCLNPTWNSLGIRTSFSQVCGSFSRADPRTKYSHHYSAGVVLSIPREDLVAKWMKDDGFHHGFIHPPKPSNMAAHPVLYVGLLEGRSRR